MQLAHPFHGGSGDSGLPALVFALSSVARTLIFVKRDAVLQGKTHNENSPGQDPQVLGRLLV